ncbi:MAG: leucine-rich repeat protein [Ruminococcus sp.]|nr:leucine-rich repeat protein [Ruminococcus sp.]
MKKRISVLTAFCIQLVFMTLPLPVASAKSLNYSLFDKFLKYDLCITDYNALTEEEKDLCHFIFDTEQSAEETVICERARRTLAHDPNIGDRLKLEQLEECYGIWDQYSPSLFGCTYYMHCVPDIKYLYDCFDYNEYWLDDTGTVKVRSIGENTGDSSSTYRDNFIFIINDADDISEFDEFLKKHEQYPLKNKDGSYSISFSIKRNKLTPGGVDRHNTYIKDDNSYYNFMELDGINGFVVYDGDLYRINDCNEAELVMSQYAVCERHTSEAPPITEKVIIPSEINGCPVTGIGYGAFYNSFVTEVILPNTITRIESQAFFGCIHLSDINFPDSLRYIGFSAFDGCAFKNLQIDLPDLVIGPRAFMRCNDLEEISINADTVDEQAFSCGSLKKVTFGDNIRYIHASAFGACPSLEEVKLSDSVKDIGTGAFGKIKKDACGLRTVFIPPTVEIIGALPRATGIGATSGIEVKATNPLTNEQECAFDSECVIKGYRGTEAERYANEWELEFVPLEAETGDVNLDGEINVADAVALQRFLLGKYVSTGAYYGDMNEDGEVDAFDMIQMRKSLLEKTKSTVES